MLATLQKDGFLDIPDISLFSVTSITQLVQEYQELFDTEPEGVVLPVSSSGGLSYKSVELGVENVSPKSEKGIVYDLVHAMQEAVDLRLSIYLFINPTLPFTTTSSDYNLVDSSGDESPKCCIVNIYTREVIKTIIQETSEIAAKNGISIKGYVFDVGNLLPMGASGDKLELTCLCEHCKEKLVEASPGLKLSRFQVSPNPWNLALKDTGNGISHVRNIFLSDQPKDILQKSRDKKFFTSKSFNNLSEGDLDDWANQLHRYIKARSQITCDAIVDIIESVPDGVNSVLITEQFPYDWTSGLFFESILQMEIDELWLPPGKLPFSNGNTRKIRTYLVSRGRYLVDAFFELVHFTKATSFLDPDRSGTELPLNALKSQFISRSHKLKQGSHLTKMDILPIRKSGRSFVAPVMSDHLMQHMMSQLGLQRSEDIMGKMAQLADFFSQVKFEE